MKWQNALKDYQLYLKIERGLSQNSIDNYSLDIKKLIAYMEENAINASAITISSDIIQQFIYTSAKSLNARSQSRLISGLKSFFNYLVFEDYRKDNPLELVESPKIGRKLPDILTEEEIDQIISAIDLSKPEGERNRAMLETLYGCGLRVSELINLKLSDLFFEEGFIKVTGKGDKQRFVPIVATTIKYINIYKNEVRNKTSIQSGYEDTLFLNRRGKQLTRAMIFTIIKQLVEKIGLKKNVSPHTFRHSFATHLLENNADLRAIQLMLGHESITTTEIYVHLDKSHLTDVVEKYHPRN
ncbi:site-specific tyrosine recombinase XerD [Jejuia pallidilutea]|uniref:Tyrosine recombinase XerC n=1 Tax=Jejuia pallidilutea TaxID=504487 RepID=A0A090W4C3_9FLAO|nr:site-specific tyrosine recombinase XerD [Jejuia pallidilutea]GAL67295.1 integrase [Jejuia pallidilutea]GAL71043.1 integrase [Jejuia pallidilutea]GAL90030.1 integrase [Jejuia pallidilutea]